MTYLYTENSSELSEYAITEHEKEELLLVRN